MIPLMQQENRRLDQNKDDDKNYHKQGGHDLLSEKNLILPFGKLLQTNWLACVSGICKYRAFQGWGCLQNDLINVQCVQNFIFKEQFS